MKAALRGVLVAFAVVPALTTLAHSQTHRMHIGPQIAYDFDVEEVGLGAQFSAPIAHRLEFYPSLVFFFVNPGSFANLNIDLKYRVARDQPNWLYVGSGLNLARSSVNGNSNTDAGLNLFVGAESLKGKIHPFVEGRLVVGDGSRVQINGGLNITLGH